MSFGKSSNKTQQTQTSSGTQTQAIDPEVSAALKANYSRALGLANGSSYQPVSAQQIQGYMNPFTQSVIDATNAQSYDDQNQQIQRNNGAAVAAHAYGGDRQVVADSLTNKNFMQQRAQSTASLNAANYTQALQAAQSENNNQNNWPLIFQNLLNASLGLNVTGADKTVTSNNTSSGTGSSSGLNFGASYSGRGFGG